MIHSLAGGRLQETKIVDIVKLEFDEKLGELFVYLSDISNLEANDVVLAPFGLLDEPKRAVVKSINKNVNTQNISTNIKRLKYVYKKIDN